MSLSEFARAAINTTAAQDGWLIGEGVDPAWLYLGMARYGYAKAALNEDGTWEPDGSGVGVIVIPEIPTLGPGGILSEDTGDLIAIDPRFPDRMFSLDGCAMINPAAVDYARHFETELTIFDNPIRYLAGQQHGCVIVNWSEMSAFKLIGAQKIVCQSVAVAEKIDALFKASRAPEIHIIQNAIQGAA